MQPGRGGLVPLITRLVGLRDACCQAFRPCGLIRRSLAVPDCEKYIQRLRVAVVLTERVDGDERHYDRE